MRCSNCGKKVHDKNGVCKFCGAQNQPKREKTNKLGNCALVFAFLVPTVGLLLGIIAAAIGPKEGDKVLTKDGIKAIIMSIVVMAVWALLVFVIIMVGWAAPFIVLSM